MNFFIKIQNKRVLTCVSSASLKLIFHDTNNNVLDRDCFSHNKEYHLRVWQDYHCMNLGSCKYWDTKKSCDRSCPYA